VGFDFSRGVRAIYGEGSARHSIIKSLLARCAASVDLLSSAEISGSGGEAAVDELFHTRIDTARYLFRTEN
jgi:hypothetical protein